MIIPKLCQQRTALVLRKCRSRQCLYSSVHGRGLHLVPQLDHIRYYQEHGIPNVMSKEGFEIAWTHYQGYLCRSLNQMVSGTIFDFESTKKLALRFARSSEHAALFNFASMAHNNHFFFRTMSPTPRPMPEKLVQHINVSFSSVASLRTTFLATADAMFGPGFVWLIKTSDAHSDSKLSILSTYIAGSPYPGAHFRAQHRDLNTYTTNTLPNQSGIEYANSRETQKAGSMGRYARGQPELPPGSIDLEVLLGVSTWQHSYLRDWGTGGKRRFLEEWWETIDWEAAYKRGAWWGPNGKSVRKLGSY